MTTAGPWQLPPTFRRLLYHEPVTRIRVCGSGPQDLAIESHRPPVYEVRDDQRSGHMWITDWTTRAACKGTDPDELFVQGAAQNRAKLICRGCLVRTECLADALDNGIEFGVWGGMTERERRALLRRRPDVKSWRELLEQARDRYEQDDDMDDLVAS